MNGNLGLGLNLPVLQARQFVSEHDKPARWDHVDNPIYREHRRRMAEVPPEVVIPRPRPFKMDICRLRGGVFSEYLKAACFLGLIWGLSQALGLLDSLPGI